MTQWHRWWGEKLAERCLASLQKHGFDAHFAPDVDSARTLILGLIQGFDSFGFGGSETTRFLGLIEILRQKGKTLYDHWQEGISAEQDLALRLCQGRCDCFLCSANAISATGEIVNVDGIGNRTNAMSFGTRKVVIVAGINKITQNLEDALRRVREIAAPMRAKSLGKSTPCAETGVCTDCNSPQRICRITTIVHRRPLLSDVSVVLINEALGF